MRRFTCALIASAFLALAGAAGAAQLTVDDHPGGLLQTQKMWMEKFVEAGLTLRFVGMCSSACTLGLGTPNACVEPTATFGFHQFAHDFSGKTYDTPFTFAWYRRWAPELLPIVEALKLTPSLQWKTATELVDAGVTRWCEKE